MHHFGRFQADALAEPALYKGHSDGYTETSLIGRSNGSVHTGLTIAELRAGGRVDPHVHSFEEGFYILSGEAVVTLNGSSYLMGPGDYGVAKVGTPHAWHATNAGAVRWFQMAAPQPKPAGAERDTFFPRDRSVPSQAARLDLSSDLKGNLLGHFDAAQIPPVGQRQNVAAGLEGVFLKWMIDENFGSRHHRMLFIEYQPGVGIGLHDHTFEEGYFILEGEVEAVMDGKTYRLTPGDVVWTSVGCVHSFKNVSSAPVRWLETFAPQPPKEDVFRFMAQWDARAKELEG
jgi:quercetin dioxygenase-like cupin family protein